MQSKNANTKERIDERTRKAAVESMTVIALDEAGEYKVYSGTRKSYVVDLIVGTCDCPDEEHNHPADGCKHRQRVEMELGQREIPNLGTRTDVEIMSGRERETEPVAIADGGTIAAPDPQESDDEDTPACLCEMVDDGELGCFEHFEVSG